MITPTRFGLKYAPIPTLALEYEDNLRSIDDGAATSLYVYNGGSDNDNDIDKHARRMKKLHVVELPALTKHSEAVAVARQLQQDNQRFLSSAVIKEDQLVRLLERLMAHLQATELSVSSSSSPPPLTAKENSRAADGGSGSVAAMAGRFGSHADDAGSGDEDADKKQESESESELEESAMDESIAKASASMDISRGDDDKNDADDDDGDKSKLVAHTRHEQHDGVDAAIATGKPANDSELKISQEARNQSEHNDNDASAAVSTTKPSGTASNDENDAREAQDDAAKRKALRSESEASDHSEEDIQSEELEYFSEDASDEDSF